VAGMSPAIKTTQPPIPATITFELSREEADAALNALESEITACEDNLAEKHDEEESLYLGFVKRAHDLIRNAIPDGSAPEHRGPYTIAQWEDGSFLVHHDQRGEVGGAPDLQEARNLVEDLLREEEVTQARAGDRRAAERARRATVLAQEEIERGRAA
jgi:hypothetical protein